MAIMDFETQITKTSAMVGGMDSRRVSSEVAWLVKRELKRLVDESDGPVSELAAKLNVSGAHVGGVINGNKNVGPTLAANLADYLQMTKSQFEQLAAEEYKKSGQSTERPHSFSIPSTAIGAQKWWPALKQQTLARYPRLDPDVLAHLERTFSADAFPTERYTVETIKRLHDLYEDTRAPIRDEDDPYERSGYRVKEAMEMAKKLAGDK